MICLKFRTGSLIVFWFLDSGHGLHGDVSVRVEVVDHGVVVLIRVLVADLLAEFLCVADFWSFDDAGLLFYGQLFVVLDFLVDSPCCFISFVGGGASSMSFDDSSSGPVFRTDDPVFGIRSHIFGVGRHVCGGFAFRQLDGESGSPTCGTCTCSDSDLPIFWKLTVLLQCFDVRAHEFRVFRRTATGIVFAAGNGGGSHVAFRLHGGLDDRLINGRRAFR